MKITKVTYRRGANLGNFETVHFEIESELGEGDTFASVYNDLRNKTKKAIDFEAKENAEIKRDERGARL